MQTATTTRNARKRAAKKAPAVLVTRRELSKLLDVNLRTISKWETEGMPLAERGRGGHPSRFDQAKCRAWSDARKAAGAGSDVARSRVRRDNAAAALLEQTLAARSRELLPAHEVEQAWSKEAAAIRAHILGWPQTVSGAVHSAALLHGVGGVEAELHRAGRQLLMELAGGPVFQCPHCGKDVTTR